MGNPPGQEEEDLDACLIEGEGEGEESLDHFGTHPPHMAAKSKQSPGKLFLHVVSASVVLFLLFQIYTLHVQPLPQIMPNYSTSLANYNFSWSTSCLNPFASSTAVERLRQSVTFVPLKDLRFGNKAVEGHTWFMSSLWDTHEDGEVQYQHFPSESSKGRVLCMKGHDKHDGSWNYYGLAWAIALPENATLMKGLTFVSYNHYDYTNIWHGLSALLPFGAWHLKNQCRMPSRWLLYHWGELRINMGPWLSTLMEAVYGPHGVKIEDLEEATTPVCFEEAVVMRHNEGGMSRLRREEVYDLLRCKARAYCHLTNAQNENKTKPEVAVTMFMRTGARSFKNHTHVIAIFDKECRNIQGCRLQVAYSNNLTLCQQVKIMSETDVLISPHGAQLTNMFLMDKGSSVMEFFPKGWLKLAGVGQYVYHWIASWSGMRHKGAWRDSDGPPCDFPEDDRRCMTLYKNAQIGHNETHFTEWARTVFYEARVRNLEEASNTTMTKDIRCGCA